MDGHPNGRIINNIGLDPDIVIPIEEETEDDIQLNAAIELLQERLSNESEVTKQ